MGYKLYSNITCQNPEEGATKNIVLEKVFFTKKCTLCETSRTLKTDVLKILEHCFQNMNCFSWIKLISVLIYFKYCNYNIPSLELPCLPWHLCQISPWPPETLLNTILIMFSIGFPILFSPIQLHATIIGCTKPYAKLSQSDLSSSYI